MDLPVDKPVKYQIYTDLQEKYDELLQRCHTLQLENQEYQKEIKEINDEQSELLQASHSEHLGALEEHEQLQFTQLTLNGMSDALQDAELLQIQLSTTNEQFKDENTHLVSENATLKKEKKKYKLILETMKKSAVRKELEHQHEIQDLQNEMQNNQSAMAQKYELLQDDYDKLRQELQETDADFDTEIEKNVGGLVENNTTKHIQFNQTIKSLPSTDDIFGNRQSIASVPGTDPIFGNMQSSFNDEIITRGQSMSVKFAEYTTINQYSVNPSGLYDDGLPLEDTNINLIKNQMQVEFENKLQEEKRKWMRQVNDLKKQILEYKKADHGIKGSKFTEENHGRNTNVQETLPTDASSCKVFGWTCF